MRSPVTASSNLVARAQAVERRDVGDAIVDAVDVLLGRYGDKRIGIEDVVREVVMGKGRVYLSFRSKEDSVLSYIDRLVARLCQQLAGIAAEERPSRLGARAPHARRTRLVGWTA